MTAGGLAAYLPRLAREWLVHEPTTKARELEGSLAFVDITGFTQLSERLARLGREGAEQLADSINGCFTRLLAVAYGEGGSLLKFGGDALLLLFTGDGHATRACRSAFGMRRTLRSIGRVETPAGRVVLRMSIGVHSGPVQCFLVGSSHRELLVTGPTATTTVAMEAAAQAGEILVSPATAAALPPSILGTEREQGILLRREPAIHYSTPPDDHHPGAAGVAGAGVPLAVRACLEDGPLEPEHRQATVAFLHFEGTDQLIRRSGPEAAADALEELVADVQDAADRAGVSFLTSDIDRNGGKLVLAAGVPLSRGDDTQRMLTALDGIAASPRALPVRIGVHHGDVFAGDIGPPYRRTYTVMGDAVNLAARLMTKARPGQIVASADVLERARDTVDAVALDPFTVKGKRRPVTASVVRDVAPVTVPRTHPFALVGRQRELSTLVAAAASAGSGRGQVVVLEGDAGVGKSRLLEEFADRTPDATFVDISCQLYDAATPYAAFRAPLRSLLGMRADAGRRTAGEVLLACLDRLAPELGRWAALLAVVVDAEVEPTAEVRNLDERFRPGRLRQAVTELLAALLTDATVLRVEDAQWIDEASSELLASLCRAAAEHPWCIVIAHRPTDTGPTEWSRGTHATTLRLAPLADVDATTLATLVARDEPLPRQTTAELVRRSGGNPLFLSELTAAARQAGGLEQLPDSVEGLIVARIDRVPAGPRRILRYLSALGPSFPTDLARRIVADDLDAAELREFLIEDRGTVRFVHSLIREAAYESLPYRTRRGLHATAGDAIRAGTDDPDRHADVLSFHFLHARRYDEAWRYALVAADAARQAYANGAAAELYRRALSAARHVQSCGGRVAAVHEALGDVLERMGAYQEAAAAYRDARLHVDGDGIADARLMLKLARMHGWLRRYSQSLSWVTRALSALRPLRTRDADVQRAQLTVWYGHFLQEQGRHAKAIAWCLRAADMAAGCGEHEALAHAYRTLDWAYVSLGRLDAATYSGRALDLYQQLGDLMGQAHTVHNMASIAYLRGDWQAALQFNRQAIALYTRTGADVDVAYSQANMAEILLDQGRVDEAEVLFAEILQVSVASGRRWIVAFARKNLGRIAARTGRCAEARDLLEQALLEYEDIGARVETIETDVRLAELDLFEGDVTSALRRADRAAAGARALGGVAMSAPAIHRVRGYALLAAGDPAAAGVAFDAALDVARARGASFEVALGLAAVCDLHTAIGRTPPPAAVAERDATLCSLGVESLAPVPLVREPVGMVAG